MLSSSFILQKFRRGVHPPEFAQGGGGNGLFHPPVHAFGCSDGELEHTNSYKQTREIYILIGLRGALPTI